MSTPHHPHGAPTGTNAPVNIAPPNWQCPHCRSKYGTNLEAATQCAEAGPAPDAEAGVPVLVLTGTRDRVVTAKFGTTDVGPVRAEQTDTGRIHTRDVVVSGQRLTAAQVAEAGRADDGLRLVTETASSRALGPSSVSPSLSKWDGIAKLFLGDNIRSSYRDPGLTVWVEKPYRSGRDWAWWSAPNEQQRAALDLVTGGLLERIAALDVDELTALIRAGYSPRAQHYRHTMPASMAAPNGGLMLAQAHGAPTHIWALRWLTVHLDEVTAWQASTLHAWATGTGGPLPGATVPAVGESLPKNPGKRRLAVMEPYGEDYRAVRDAVLDELTTDAIVNPVPGIPDVTDTMRQTKKEGADDV